jgi:hypothetical protein
VVFLDPSGRLTPDLPRVAIEENPNGGGWIVGGESRAAGSLEREMKHALGAVVDELLIRIFLGSEGAQS